MERQVDSKRTQTVLLVDDDPGIRLLLTAYLSKYGFRIIEKKNGREALEYIVENGCSKPDVVVTDIQMPEMDGVALATWLLTNCPTVGVVLMSGYADVQQINYENPDHNWMFVPKPFLPGVIDAINTVLQSQPGVTTPEPKEVSAC